MAGAVKRLFDVVGSVLCLIVLLPLMVAVAAIVRMEGGPTLYRQSRVGLSGKRFTIIKFRTMRVDAESDLGPMWSVRDDPRCTPIGAILRRHGLDELPQLWNILRGQMSFVGPRPERPEFVAQFSAEQPGYAERHTVRCGLTGFAQVHGWRGSTSMEERLRHDIYYVRNWSLGLDARVLLLTLLHGWSEQTRDGCGH